MNHEQITLRVNQIEFRWSPTNNKYELLKWHSRQEGGEHCTVIAFFDYQREGVDMRTVGRRYEEAYRKHPGPTGIATRYAFDFLQARFDAEEAIKDLHPWL